MIWKPYGKIAARLGLKDLGITKGIYHPQCNNARFRYGIRPDGTVVEYCPKCGEIWEYQRDDYCPHCRQTLSPHHKTIKGHLKGRGSKWRIVCRKPQ